MRSAPLFQRQFIITEKFVTSRFINLINQINRSKEYLNIALRRRKILNFDAEAVASQPPLGCVYCQNGVLCQRNLVCFNNKGAQKEIGTDVY